MVNINLPLPIDTLSQRMLGLGVTDTLAGGTATSMAILRARFIANQNINGVSTLIGDMGAVPIGADGTVAQVIAESAITTTGITLGTTTGTGAIANISGILLSTGTVNSYDLLREASSTGASFGATGVLAAATAVWDSTAAAYIPNKSAKTVVDTETGANFGVNALMALNGANFVRLRADSSFNLMVNVQALPAGTNLIGALHIQDATTTHQAVVTTFHTADAQALGSSGYGLLTGSVSQLLNGVNLLDRQRETGGDAVVSQGLMANVHQMALPYATTSTTTIAIGAANAIIVVAAASGTSRGVAWSIQIGTLLLLDSGTNQEYAYVTAVSGTSITILPTANTAGTSAFIHGHSGTYAVNGFVYNQSRDASVVDGSAPTGVAAQMSFVWNTLLNSGAGGIEARRSVAGERDGSIGNGAAMLAGYAFNSQGPNGSMYDRVRSLQGKGYANATIATATVGSTVITLSAAAPSTLIAGMHIQLYGGTVESAYVASVSGTTVNITSNIVNSGHISIVWDVFTTNGPELNNVTPIGILPNALVICGPSTGLYYGTRSADQDAQSVVNIPAAGISLLNAAGTADRIRSSNADTFGTVLADARNPGDKSTLSTIGYTYGYNGTQWNRLQLDSNNNLKTVLGSSVVTLSAISSAITSASTNIITYRNWTVTVKANTLTDTAAIAVEVSDDGTNWFNVGFQSAIIFSFPASDGLLAQSVSTDAKHNFVRINCTSYTSGSFVGTIVGG